MPMSIKRSLVSHCAALNIDSGSLAKLLKRASLSRMYSLSSSFSLSNKESYPFACRQSERHTANLFADSDCGDSRK